MKKKLKPLKLVTIKVRFFTIGKKFFPTLTGLIALIIKGLGFTIERLLKIFTGVSLKVRYFFLGFSVCLVIFSLSQIYLFVKNLPSPNNIGKYNYPLSTHIYDRNGKLLYEIYREQNRTPVKLKDLPDYVYKATIAIEDKDFYKHQGVSLVSGIFRAIKEIVVNKSFQGGSTLTQQLVKSALLTPERTIQRKIKEIILALWTEKLYSKDQILEMYLNQVPYGGSAYGIEEAAKTYFNKHAKELTLEQAALLAGLPQAPSLYSPYIHPDYALWRRNEVINKMHEQRYITKQQQEAVLAVKSVNVVPPKTTIKAPHFVFYVKSQLEERYGISQVEEGGLNVTTTLDLDIQEKAEQILKEELDKVKHLNVGNGAILVTRPSTGEILAMVGSVDYFASPSGAYNVTTALRQPGSAIKPLLYALALNKDYTAATIIDDSPVAFQISSSEIYRPVNYDNRYHGRVPLRYALANSYNIPAVKVINSLGVTNFINYAQRLGISTWEDHSRYGLSLALGGGEVTMLDMAKAFGALANLGYRVSLSSIINIKNTGSLSIYEINPEKFKVMNESVAYIISDILADNFARQMAFGLHSALEIPGYKVAVKTGTTNDKKDNWTIGYNPDFLVLVWVGNNDNSPMHPYLTSGITGAAPIWNRVMTELLKNYSQQRKWFDKPVEITERICYFGKVEYFVKGTENKVSCREGLFTPSPTISR